MKCLETKRLILREWQDEDIPIFSAMNKDPEVRRFFPALLSDEESQGFVETFRRCYKENGFCLFAVELKETKEFIGFTGLSKPSFTAHFTPCVEIGWRLARTHWNKGYATEAAHAVLYAAFKKYGLQEVVSFTTMNNMPSRRVMEKLGMTHNPLDDFDHPSIPKDHPLCRHVLYRIQAKTVRAEDSIQIESYNQQWAEQAQQEMVKLKERCCFPWFVDIVHIGSTAIPNLPAKPILDLAIGVSHLEEAQALIPILMEEDYVFWDTNPDSTKLFFVRGMPPFGKQRTHHVHVMETSHHDWVIRPLFRDYLIQHPVVKEAYSTLKQTLSAQYCDDRESYTEGKTNFIRDINLKAASRYLEFQPLATTHFPLLLRWLETPHVKSWWNENTPWTLSLIEEKYDSYVQGYKWSQGIKKPIHAYIVTINHHPIGYIQFCDAHDCDRDEPFSFENIPHSVAAIDFYIGEPTFLQKGFGTLILKTFLEKYINPHYEACLVDPDQHNIAAIATYRKAGFREIKRQELSIIMIHSL